MDGKLEKSKVKNIIRAMAIIVVLGVFLTSATVWSYSTKKDATPSESIGSNIPYETAMQNKKPFLALFYAPWCTYCMRFMPRYKKLSEIYKGKYNFVLVNGDDTRNYSLTRDYAIGGFPTLYIVDPTIDNRVLISNTLFDDIDRIQTELDRYLRVRAMIK